MVQERLLRFAAPALYRQMVETFLNYHIHPHEIQASLVNNEDNMEVILRFCHDFSQSATASFSLEQAKNPDEAVKLFFEEAAEKCKSLLIADYYKMIKL